MHKLLPIAWYKDIFVFWRRILLDKLLGLSTIQRQKILNLCLSLTFSPTERPCMYSFLMLNDQHNESRHKSRALWNCLTCINDAEPWQRGIVRPIPPEPSPLIQAFPLSLWGPAGDIADCLLCSTTLKQVQLHTYSQAQFLDLWICSTGPECLGHRYDDCTSFLLLSGQEILQLQLGYWSSMRILNVLENKGCPDNQTAIQSWRKYHFFKVN